MSDHYTDERSFEDFFNDLDETESADTLRLNKAKCDMIMKNHPDRHKKRIEVGLDRYGDVKDYDQRTVKILRAYQNLQDREKRKRHSYKVRQEKQKRGKSMVEQRKRENKECIQKKEQELSMKFYEYMNQ